MEKKKGFSIVLMIPAIIIGIALYKQFDVENLKFENLGLAIVYFFGLAISVIYLINDSRKRPDKKSSR